MWLCPKPSVKRQPSSTNSTASVASVSSTYAKLNTHSRTTTIVWHVCSPSSPSLTRFIHSTRISWTFFMIRTTTSLPWVKSTWLDIWLISKRVTLFVVFYLYFLCYYIHNLNAKKTWILMLEVLGLG